MIERREAKNGVRFVVYHNSGGRRRYVGSYGTNKEAEHAEQEFAVTRRRIDRGELAEDADPERTFRQASEEWLESLESRASRSTEVYRKRLQIYVWREFGDTRLGDITKPMIMAYRDRLARKFAPATVNGNLTCLSSAFSYFVDRQWVERNPCSRVKAVENPQTSYNWIRTREEITRLLVACAGDLREMVALALATGLRLDELLHLEWSDLDLDRRLITVHRGRKGTVKSGRLRHVPILDSVLDMLRQRALRRGGAKVVFPSPPRKTRGPRGAIVAGGVRDRAAVRQIYKLALQRAGLDETMRWHDLRHTFASHWMMDGGDIFKLSRILGHATVVMTMRYAHLAPAAFEPDYGRLCFHVPTEPAKIVELVRGEGGRVLGTRRVGSAAL
jgi:integrase